MCARRLQRAHAPLEAPTKVGVEVRGGVNASLTLVSGEMGGHGKPQHRVIGRVGGGKGVGSHLTRTAPRGLTVNAANPYVRELAV